VNTFVKKTKRSYVQPSLSVSVFATRLVSASKQPRSSRRHVVYNSDRRKPSPRRKEIADRLTTAQTVAPAPPAAKTSSPTTGRSSDIFLRRESPTPDAKNVGGSTPPSPPSTTPARVDELRSRLKRMKRVESSNEEQTDEKPVSCCCCL